MLNKSALIKAIQDWDFEGRGVERENRRDIKVKHRG